jgi:hypothetical protein
MNTRRVKLPLIHPADAIDAAQSRPVQMLALRCRPSDANHRGLLHAMATLARSAVDTCLAPGARSVPLDCIAEIQRWSASPFPLKSNALRSQLLEACVSSEQATANAVAQMLTLSPAPNSELSPHLAHVLVRHARQASYQACSAVVLTLDALDEPRRAVDVPAQVAAAVAYQAIWSTGSATLLERVREYAEFWMEHDPRMHQTQTPPHTRRELELQFLHEFIGVTWKAQRDAQFGRLCSFLDWALSSSGAAR